MLTLLRMFPNCRSKLVACAFSLEGRRYGYETCRFFRGVAGGKVSGCKGESSYRSPNEAQRRVVDRTHSNVVSSVESRNQPTGQRVDKVEVRARFHVRLPK